MTRQQTFGFLAMCAIATPAVPLAVLLERALPDAPFVIAVLAGLGVFLLLLVVAHRVRGRIDPTYDAAQAIRGARPGATRNAGVIVLVAMVSLLSALLILDDVSGGGLLAIVVAAGFLAAWAGEQRAATRRRV